MSNRNTLEKRPSPEQIKFTDDCFEIVGFRFVYSVSNFLGGNLHETRNFGENRIEAEKAAKRSNLPVIETKEPIRKRIKWF